MTCKGKVINLIKTLIGGIAVGVANIIPGVSGGTMMVVLGIFNKVTESISNLVSKDNKKRMEAIIFLAQVLVGAVIGLVGFAKVIEFLFNNYPTQTMYWFIGLIAFSIPLFLKSEMKGEKINLIPFIAGLVIIFGLEFLNPGNSEAEVNPVFPPITIGLCIKMIFIGAIAGGTMLMPGVSGSMVLLILGEYYLFKSYLANIMSFSLDIFIPLGFMGIGILLGIVISAKLCDYFLAKYHRGTLSFILGLIVASSLVLIPFNAAYDLTVIITSIVALLFGGLIVIGLGKLQ